MIIKINLTKEQLKATLKEFIDDDTKVDISDEGIERAFNFIEATLNDHLYDVIKDWVYEMQHEED